LIAKNYAILSTYETKFLNDIGNGYLREFIKNGTTYIDYEDLYLKFGNKNVQEHILNIIDKNDLKVLIYQAGPTDFHFSVEFFQKLQRKVFTVMMIGDTDHYFDTRDIYYAQCMNLVIVYDCLSRYRFGQYGIDAISFYSSYDKNKYFKMSTAEKSIDVSFVGDMRYKRNRKEYINYIIKNGISVEVFGLGTKNGQVSLEQMVEISNKTKINLNFSGTSLKSGLRKEPNINLRMRQMKGRIAEIALSGGFVLSEYVPGIEEVFEVDKEIVIFRTKEEMVAKIKYYLEHEKGRETIANNGHIRAVRDYEVSTAIPKLINQIEEFRNRKIYRPSELYLDNHFMKYYTTFRVAMIVEFIKLGKWKLIFEELGIILKNRKLDFYQTLKFLLNMFPKLKKLLKFILS